MQKCDCLIARRGTIARQLSHGVRFDPYPAANVGIGRRISNGAEVFQAAKYDCPATNGARKRCHPRPIGHGSKRQIVFRNRFLLSIRSEKGAAHKVFMHMRGIRRIGQDDVHTTGRKSFEARDRIRDASNPKCRKSIHSDFAGERGRQRMDLERIFARGL